MALSNPGRGRGWSRWHFWVRIAGLTGLVLAGIGLVILAVAAKAPGRELAVAGWVSAAAGGALALLALLFEVKAAVELVAGRRGAAGSNVALQIILAAALVTGVNAFSFLHYQRWDWTRDRLFTIDADIRNDLMKLQRDTTVVVYLPHRNFGQADKPDDIEYDTAAERKVVEKVKDLVEEFQELGPQFKVVVLDVQEKKGYRSKLAALKQEAPELRAAIDRATENTIFFYAGGKVQELGFHDIYQLDKQASREANEGAGNLVLYSQGKGPFARKVLNVEEKRPRIAIGVIHEVLGVENGSEEYGMPGLKKVLTARGFDTREIVLKKGWGVGLPEPAALTYDENRYEDLEDQIGELNETIKKREEEMRSLKEAVDEWKSASLEDLTKKYAKRLDLDKVTEPERRFRVSLMGQIATLRELELKGYQDERAAAEKQKAGLNVEELEEKRRMADLHAKMNRLLADCDLLILPRPTVLNVMRPPQNIPGWLYKLDDGQFEAIKDFLKGKPILFCLGPVNDAPGEPDPLPGADKLEPALVAPLGFKLSHQTVLFNIQSKLFGERRGNVLIIRESNVEVPPVEFDWPAGAGQPLWRGASAKPKAPNPVRESMGIMAHSLGKDNVDLRLRYPRPVYYQPSDSRNEQPFDAIFMMTDPGCWNDDQPFPSRERVPRYEKPKTGDPTIGTTDEKRLGPFPIGVAAEVTLPPNWYPDKNGEPGKVRVAVIGHGDPFSGGTLSPAKEKLFLNVSNWLLGRDDLLAKRDQVWEYPRVALSSERYALWQWGTRLGLPLLFVYLGMIVFLVRRLR